MTTTAIGWLTTDQSHRLPVRRLRASLSGRGREGRRRAVKHTLVQNAVCHEAFHLPYVVVARIVKVDDRACDQMTHDVSNRSGQGLCSFETEQGFRLVGTHPIAS